MTTKTKVADRYAALCAIVETLDGVAFTPAKKPTAKDCEELSRLIDDHKFNEQLKRERALEAAQADDEDDEDDAPAQTPVGALVEALEQLDAIDGGTSAAVLRKGSAEERAAAIEAKRAEARRRFETATKATTAHGYALIAAATADGDRMENMRAKLAEMPEAVRAGACKLAAEKLVQPGSTMQADLRRLYDEQPVAAKPTTKGKRSDFIVDEVAAIKSYGGIICLRGRSIAERVGKKFSVSASVVDGKLVITATET